jgi:hypothetical protein
MDKAKLCGQADLIQVFSGNSQDRKWRRNRHEIQTILPKYEN